MRLVEFLLRCVQLPLQGHDQIDQPIGRDPPRTNILPELLNIHASLIVSVAKCVLGLNLRRIAQKYSSKTEPILCRSRYFLEKTGCGTSKSSRSTSDAKSV